MARHKAGRNLKKCQAYKIADRRERNKARKQVRIRNGLPPHREV